MFKITQNLNSGNFGKFYNGIVPSDQTCSQPTKKSMAEVANNLNNTMTTWLGIVALEESASLVIKAHKQKITPNELAKQKVLTAKENVLKLFRSDDLVGKLADEAKNATKKSNIFSVIKQGLTNFAKKQKALIKSPDLILKIGSKLGKITKANIPYIIAASAIELGVNVIPAYKNLGEEKGKKQLKKSVIQLIADILGWEACFGIGKSVGVMLPKAANPLGFVISRVMGAATGFLGSCLFCNITSKFTGKNELELAKVSR